jgi:hypothetical protein
MIVLMRTRCAVVDMRQVRCAHVELAEVDVPDDQTISLRLQRELVEQRTRHAIEMLFTRMALHQRDVHPDLVVA